MNNRLRELLNELRPGDNALVNRVEEIVESHRARVTAHRREFSAPAEEEFPVNHRDVILLARTDTFREEQERPLQYLYRFLEELCDDVFSGVHFPAADDAFAGVYLSTDDEAIRFREDMETLGSEFLLSRAFNIPGVDGGKLPEALNSILESLALGTQCVLLEEPGDSRLVPLLREVLFDLDPGTLLMPDQMEYTDALPVLLKERLEQGDPKPMRTWYESQAESVPIFTVRTGTIGTLTDPNLPAPQRARTYLSGQAVLLATASLPGVDIHSLVASEAPGVLHYDDLRNELRDRDSLRSIVFEGYLDLLRARTGEIAFDPRGGRSLVESDPRVLALRRWSPASESSADAGNDRADDSSVVLCLHNLSSDHVSFRDRRDRYPWPEEGVVRELISEDLLFPTAEGELFSLDLQPWEVMWLRFT